MSVSPSANRIHTIFVMCVTLTLGCSKTGDSTNGGTALPDDAGESTDTSGGSPGSGSAPAVNIIEPYDSDIFRSKESIALKAKVTDSDQAPSTVDATWVSDRDGVLWKGKPDDAGIVSFDWTTATSGLHQVTIQVFDANSNATADSIQIRVNDAPSAVKIAIEPFQPKTQDNLEVIILETSVDPNKSDSVTYLYAWWKDDSIVSGLTGPKVSHVNTRRGETWRVAVTPTDTYHMGPTTKVEVEIQNTPPVFGAAQVLPSVGNSQTTFRCHGQQWSDPDNDPEGSSIVWLVNDQPIRAEQEDTLTPNHFKKGDVVQCVVTPHDGIESGTPISSQKITIDNTPASVEGVTLSPTDGNVTTLFQCNYSTLSDLDGDDISVEIVWTLNKSVLPGTTSTQLIPKTIGAKKGDILGCRAVPVDGTSKGSPVDSNTVKLANATPSATSVLIKSTAIDGKTTEIDTLTCETAGASDPDGDPVGAIVSWYVNDSVVKLSSGEPNESPTLAGNSFDKGDKVWCAATVSDGQLQSAPIESKNSIWIVNHPPSLSAVTAYPSSPTKNTPLECSWSGWSDPDPADSESMLSVSDPMDDGIPTVQIQWLANNETIPLANKKTFVPVDLAPGYAVTCQVTPYDGQDYGLPIASAPVTVTNHPPTIAGVIITPDPAYSGSTLACQPYGWSDVDGDAEGTLFAWYKNGIPIPGQQGSTLASSFFAKGDSIYCEATPYDGFDEGASHVSVPPTVIQNQAPSINAAQLSPASGNKNTVFTCSPEQPKDPDPSDAIFYVYEWFYEDGTPVDNQESNTILGNIFLPSTAFYCVITPTDGLDYGEAKTSNLSTIINNPPKISGVVLGPTNATSISQLQCEPIGYSDPDGDLPVFFYKWFKNGKHLEGMETATLPPGQVKKGDVVYCQVVPSDGVTAGVGVASNSLTIGNGAPTTPLVAVTPATPAAGQPLVCKVLSGGVDPDGGPVTYDFAWMVDGTLVVGLTTATVDGTQTTGCGQWTCSVVAKDADGASSAAGTASVSLASGKALIFGGLDKALATNATSLNTSALVTVDVWVNPALLIETTIVERMNGKVGQAGSNGYALRMDNTGTVKFVVLNNGTEHITAAFPGTPKLVPGLFTHIAGTYDGAKLKVWVNGVWSGNKNLVVSDFYKTTGDLIVGNSALLPNNGYVGTLDEVRISKVVRYSQDFVAPSSFKPDTDTIALYHFEEGSGLIAYDSAKANNLVLFGATYGSGSCIDSGSAPSDPLVQILPQNPSDSDALVCNATGSIDPDGDVVSYAYSWLLNGVLQPLLNTNTVAASLTTDCDNWTCVAVATDGQLTSDPNEDTVTVAPAGGNKTVYAYDANSGQSTFYAFTDDEVYAATFSFSASEFPIKINKVHFYGKPQYGAFVDIWAVDNAYINTPPAKKVQINPSGVGWHTASLGHTFTTPTKYIRVGVEATAYLGITGYYRANGTGIHLIRGCQTLLPNLGCIDFSGNPLPTTWQDAFDFTKQSTHWEIHIEVETAESSGMCL
ncbi:MAG: LamG domain-containing protein [Myxococcales bacterium]|nr:LamG domain-containing protein [Myxococcales bacterium]